MASFSTQDTAAVRPAGHRPWLYYGWVNVVIGAIAMTGTLPGRTHGIGLVTKSLLEDFQLSNSQFAHMNLVATLLGAFGGAIVGPLIDRWGTRSVVTLVSLLLGGVVCWMSQTTSTSALLTSLTLTRALGQCALSVVAMAIVGKWFRRRAGLAMGVYTVLLAVGFIGVTLGADHLVQVQGWRIAWWNVGLALSLGLAPLGLIFVKSTPESAGVDAETIAAEFAEDVGRDHHLAEINLTLAQTLITPWFWIDALSASFYNLTWSATSLFGQSIWEERGLTRDDYVLGLAVMTGTGLLTNGSTGWAASRWHLTKLLAIGMAMLGAALFAFPMIETRTGVMVQNAIYGVAGGIVTVVFSAAWPKEFGRKHLGKIQGAAQVLSVVASAAGPVLLTRFHEFTGDYTIGFRVAAGVACLLGVCSGMMTSLFAPAVSEAIEERSLPG